MIANSLREEEKGAIKDIIEEYEDISNVQLEQYDEQGRSNILYAAKIILKNKAMDKSNYSSYQNAIKEINHSLSLLPKQNLQNDIKNPVFNHKTTQLSAAYGVENDEEVFKLSFYPVYNDISNDNSEYFNEFDLKLLNFEAIYYQNHNKLRLDNLELIKIKTIIDYNSLIGGVSSGLKINIERENNAVQTTNLYPNIESNLGLAQSLFKNQLISYFLLSPSYAYYNNDSNPYFYPELGFIFYYRKNFKTYTKYRKYFAANSYKYDELISIEQIFFLEKNHNLVFEYEYIEGDFKDTKNLFLKYKYSF